MTYSNTYQLLSFSSVISLSLVIINTLVAIQCAQMSPVVGVVVGVVVGGVERQKSFTCWNDWHCEFAYGQVR